MDIKESLEEFKIIMHLPFPGGKSVMFLGKELTGIDINETVLVSWIVMAILIVSSFLLTRNLKQVPQGVQVFLEWIVEFLNSFSKDQFGSRSRIYGPYIGTIFLFVFLANIIGVFSPLSISLFGVEPPFTIKPPTRDINLTAALALISILVVIIGGLRARGVQGWLKNLLHPLPLMLPFNVLEYIIRPLSLCLRLFGNILGGYIIMLLVEEALPIPVVVPGILSLYFDFFDGFIQAIIFTFLTTLFVAEAIAVEALKHE